MAVHPWFCKRLFLLSNINGTPRQAARVRGLPQEPGCKVMPGRHHALNSKMIYEAGLKVSCMSGFAVSAPPLAQPDTGLISFAKTADAKRNIEIGRAHV